MNDWTKRRLRTSISLKAVLFGIAVAGSGFLLDSLEPWLLPYFGTSETLGAWAGVLGLTGAYIALFALVILLVMEGLRYFRV